MKCMYVCKNVGSFSPPRASERALWSRPNWFCSEPCPTQRAASQPKHIHTYILTYLLRGRRSGSFRCTLTWVLICVLMYMNRSRAMKRAALRKTSTWSYNTYIHTNVDTYTIEHMYVLKHKKFSWFTWIPPYTYIHTVHTYMHTYIYIYKYTYIHTVHTSKWIFTSVKSFHSALTNNSAWEEDESMYVCMYVCIVAYVFNEN